MREIDLEAARAQGDTRRPLAPFTWYGGKGHIARSLLPLLPPSEGIDVYVEPYAGAASLFWHLPRPYPNTVLNDLDDRIVTTFRVLQDQERFDRLYHRLVWTPYARAEYERALDMLAKREDLAPEEVAWAFLVATNFALSGNPRSKGNWRRTLGARAVAPSAWQTRKSLLLRFHRRLQGVHIDAIDAIEAIRYWDSEATFFYIDPPYVLSTRSGNERRVYDHEQHDDHHRRLVEALLELRGRAMLSGYDSDLYRPLEEAGWRKRVLERGTPSAARTRLSGIRGTGATTARAKRAEVVWMNYEPGGERSLV